jgi:hypothetical protein
LRIYKPLVAALILVLAAAVCPGLTQTGQEKKTAVDKEVKSLLRKDLLQIGKQEVAPPKRNIFAPRIGSSRPGAVALPGRPLPAVDFEAADEPTAGAETAAEAPPVVMVNLRYLGFIASPRGLVALVNFEGRAIAVVEDDVVGEGIRIGKITREQVEVILPDSSTRTFSLEGE